MAVQKAFVVQSKGVAKVVAGRPVPALRPDHMMVKVKAIALNPTDWKHMDMFDVSRCVSGVEYAGIVEKLPEGNNLRSWKVGDRVAGTVHGSNVARPEDGAFQEYVIARTGVAMKIPDDMSFENAVGLSVATVSNGQGLYQQLQLPLPTDPATKPFPVLIFGGSTTMGTIAIQFAKLSGLTVITTCSPHNFELVKSRGADHVFDYKSPSAIADVQRAAGNNLCHVLDCIGEGGSQDFCYGAMGPSGGKYSSYLFPAEGSRTDVAASMVMAYDVYGSAWRGFGREFAASAVDYVFASMMCQFVEGLLGKGKLEPHPVTLNHGGWEGINAGLDKMRAGKVSGTKMVFSI